MSLAIETAGPLGADGGRVIEITSDVIGQRRDARELAELIALALPSQRRQFLARLGHGPCCEPGAHGGFAAWDAELRIVRLAALPKAGDRSEERRVGKE